MQENFSQLPELSEKSMYNKDKSLEKLKKSE